MHVIHTVLLSLLVNMVTSYKPTPDKTWAVQLEGGREEALRIAHKTGATLVKKIFGDFYLFREGEVRKAHLRNIKMEDILKAEDSVKIVKEDVLHTRQLYVHQEGHQGVVLNDPMWGSQTYLHSGPVHMNVLPAWERTQKGEGVVVGVIDDGIFTNQPDLRENLDLGLSYDIFEETTDPTPNIEQLSHGTNCAGIIAAVHNNSFCGVGVAYKAKVAGIKMFSGAMTEISDAQEASALSHEHQLISIYSCSWGPSDWNNALDGPDTVAREALVMAAREGRNGKGSIFVFSTGNGGTYGDSCAYNGYINTNNTIGIGGLLQDGSIPSFAEACTSVFAVTYSRDYIGDTANLVVPYRSSGCRASFSGTSPAAAMAAGVFSLVLSANDRLSVRDVQHLVTRTSRNSGICGQTWKENSAGFRVSDYCGFGLLDAGKLTAMAADWNSVPEQISCTEQGGILSVNIPQSGEVHTSITVQGSCVVNYLEHVLLTVRITFPHRGHLRIRLTSPGGTISDIVPGRATDMEPDLEWTFMTLHHWGESAVGPWRLSIQNTHPQLSSTGILESWTLVLLGTTAPTDSSSGANTTPGMDTAPARIKTVPPKSSASPFVSTPKKDEIPVTTRQGASGQSTSLTTRARPSMEPTSTRRPVTTPTKTLRSTVLLRSAMPVTTRHGASRQSTSLTTITRSSMELTSKRRTATTPTKTLRSTVMLRSAISSLKPSTVKLPTTYAMKHTVQPITGGQTGTVPHHKYTATVRSATKQARNVQSGHLLPGIDTAVSAVIIIFACIIVIVAMIFSVRQCHKYQNNFFRVQNGNHPALQSTRSPQVTTLQSHRHKQRRDRTRLQVTAL